MVQVYVISFGYGHAPAPEADLTLDTRRLLRNPHHDPRMRELTGLDEVVRRHVLATPGAVRLISNTAVLAADLHAQTRALVTVAVGCVGGRHRSVAIAEELAATLHSDGIKTSVTHRDVHRPVIQPSGGEVRLSDKTPEGFRRLAEKSRAKGDDRVAEELERMAQEAENASEKK